MISGYAAPMSADMPGTLDGPLLDALLDSWDRNTTILIDLLRALPEGGMEARATDRQSNGCAAVHARPLRAARVGVVPWDVWMDKGKWS